MLTCDRLADLSEGYALGALDAAEMVEVEQHGQGCADCRERLDREVELAALLALAAPVHDPPPSLRRSLIVAARGKLTAESPRRAFRRQRFPASIGVAWGAASVATLAAVVSIGWALNVQGQLPVRAAGRVAAIPAAPVTNPDDYGMGGAGVGFALERAEVKRLVGSDAAPDARGWMYVDPADQNALLVAYRLPPLPPGRAYQLWLVGRDQQRFSGGLFKVDAEGYGWLKVRAPEAFGQVARVGVTIEPVTGSDGPTGARVLGGQL